jgi:hypothetical protein
VNTKPGHDSSPGSPTSRQPSGLSKGTGGTTWSCQHNANLLHSSAAWSSDDRPSVSRQTAYRPNCHGFVLQTLARWTYLELAVCLKQDILKRIVLAKATRCRAADTPRSPFLSGLRARSVGANHRPRSDGVESVTAGATCSARWWGTWGLCELTPPASEPDVSIPARSTAHGSWARLPVDSSPHTITASRQLGVFLSMQVPVHCSNYREKKTAAKTC